PKAVEPDGKWYRCPTNDHPKKRNGAYKLATCGTVGFYQNHATETAVTTWRIDADTPRQDPLISQARAREALEEHRRKTIHATQAARAYWQSCKPLRYGHPYLAAKLLTMQGCDRLRVDSDGWLIVPVEADGNIISLQRIAPDGTKRFWSGASVKGGCYMLTSGSATMTALVEGFATGLAVYQSVPNCCVIVAFDCGNMDAVAKRLKIGGLALVAADNDHGTEARTGTNPGIIHGTAASELIGCGITWPKGIAGTDFADMLLELITAGRHANERAPQQDQVHDDAIRRSAMRRVARDIKKAMRFVAHAKEAS
ncbi:MAG: topoisomerase, partial [Gemmatimonadales bacterium]|nr:topoisomerase [Gemmatimonadales bacterium]